MWANLLIIFIITKIAKLNHILNYYLKVQYYFRRLIDSVSVSYVSIELSFCLQWRFLFFNILLMDILLTFSHKVTSKFFKIWIMFEISNILKVHNLISGFYLITTNLNKHEVNNYKHNFSSLHPKLNTKYWFIYENTCSRKIFIVNCY